MTYGLTDAEIEKIIDEMEADVEKNIESIWKRDVSTAVKERAGVPTVQGVRPRRPGPQSKG